MPEQSHVNFLPRGRDRNHFRRGMREPQVRNEMNQARLDSACES